jgi:hypothetical protein
MRFSILALILAGGAAHALQGRNLLTGETSDIKPGSKGTVTVFMSARCPCSHSHVNVIKKIAEDYGKDFQFVAVHSNSDEKAEDAAGYFRNAGLPFPVIQDNKDELANQLKANRTPFAVVQSAGGKILFKGGVTDSSDAGSAKKQYLRDALADAEAGRPVRVSEARSLGCVIQR